ncbi:hypothetical protein BaRGS_00011480 [Batillaria attramentaria]|uniref:Protein kinase domain-containing protein n=1 Tax=Batillaria attramentaria TaxID=370345 RepID=A0ABD0LCH7_9CAEN
MADGGGEQGQTHSPREDFDPLLDDSIPAPDSDSEQLSTEYPSAEEDGGPHSLGTQYGYCSSPPHPRLARREKERGGNRGGHVKRSYKEYKESKRKSHPQPRAVLSVIKDARSGGPTLCGLSGFDSDDNIDIETIREKRDKRRKDNRDSKKSMTRTRDHDRYVKRMSDDFSAMNVDSMAQTQVKLESSGRFSHLLAKSSMARSPESRGARRQWSEPPECPADRSLFSKTFSMLINLGTQAKKEKERKMATTKRQLSSELEEWQAKLMDWMWVELNAKLHCCSPEEEHQALQERRQEVQNVLEEITEFQFRHRSASRSPSENAFKPESDMALLSVGGGADNTHGACEDLGLDDDVSASFRDVVLTSDVVLLQEEALEQVQRLLGRLDACERLFPTTKKMGQEFPLYSDPNFTRRVKCLNLWLNITCDLFYKLQLFGRIIGAEQRGIEWPVTNFDQYYCYGGLHHHLGVPNIAAENTASSESEEADGEGDGEEADAIVVTPAGRGRGGDRNFLSPMKQVKFTFGSDSATSSRDTSPTQQRNACVVEPPSPVDSSTPCRNSRSSFASSVTTLSGVSSDLSLEGAGRSAVYRHYVDRCLKKMGMHKLVIRLRDIFNCTLQRAKEALESPRHSIEDLYRHPSDDAGLHETDLASSPTLGHARLYFSRSTSLAEHGEWCQEFRRMGLPSFRPSYLFLVRIPLDVVHECLRLRLEQKPLGEPSFLSIRQLIRECKEVLHAATLVKQYYQYMVDPVMWDEQEAEEKFASDLDQFDRDLRCMLDVYFQFLESWIYMLLGLPQGSQDLKSSLEDEWDFTRSICIYIIGGESEAGKRFSALASSLLSSTADFLDAGIDENTRSLYEVTSVQYALRNFKNLFHEARERASKALGFAKKLRKDMEIAADFNVTVTTAELFDKLKETEHVRVRAPVSAGYMMFVPKRIINNKRLILVLLNVTSGREDSSHWADLASSHDDGYLLLLRCESGIDHNPQCPLWTGEDVIVEPTAETAIALSHIQVEGLLYVVIHSSSLSSQRREFEQLMGKSVALVYEQTPCHQAIAESLMDLKVNALELQEKVVTSIRQVDEKLNFNDVIQHEDSLLKLYRETMLQCYNFGFEYSKEVMRLISTSQRQRLCDSLVRFSVDWMKFVVQKCERGRGTRPRWATQGLDFLTVVCDPKFLAYLTNEDFNKFKQSISDCVTHIIGTMDARPQGLPPTKPSVEIRQPFHRFMSTPEQGSARFSRSTSAQSVSSETGLHAPSGLSTPSTPSTLSPQPEIRIRRLAESHSEVNIHDDEDGGLVMDIRHKHRASAVDLQVPMTRAERIQRQIQRIEEKRDEHLREKSRIGQVSRKVQEPDYHIAVRRVKFRWQRGNKIGEGQFGKVYTAVNMNTGELMAMKEMKFQPNDLQQLRAISDEIKIFEGIQHPNLVKYHGVEVHKDEMLVFMEFCDTGTIEEASKQGLPEYLIRRYTREIVQAVNHLHENSIVHRDIKGANIFLTSKGHVKLGDFGCSVKLKSHTTMPGEFKYMVGTMAYMAPEVITEQIGYGRSADIWSLGCVVLEMFTGKRPWHEMDNNYQIMYKVGAMGHTPAIPDNISPEGKEFLSFCLKHDPTLRHLASQLLDHTFTKVTLKLLFVADHCLRDGENKALWFTMNQKKTKAAGLWSKNLEQHLQCYIISCKQTAQTVCGRQTVAFAALTDSSSCVLMLS